MRYIDADALVKRLKHSPLFLGTNMQFKDGVVDLVEKQPTADVVEVVRCKDCKHGQSQKRIGVICEYDQNGAFRAYNGFCSYGERGEG